MLPSPPLLVMMWVAREESLAHAAALVAATDVPVSADLEECFAVDTAGVAETVRLALDAGRRLSSLSQRY
jgi:2-methylisocitrate lyase-like PEP mutase family enzyme